MKLHLPKEASTAVGEQFGTTEREQNRAGGGGVGARWQKLENSKEAETEEGPKQQGNEINPKLF